MKTLLGTLALASVLALPIDARADEISDSSEQQTPPPTQSAGTHMRSPNLVIGGVVMMVGGGGLILAGVGFSALGTNNAPEDRGSADGIAAMFYVIGSLTAVLGAVAIGVGAQQVPNDKSARIWITPAGIAGRF